MYFRADAPIFINYDTVVKPEKAAEGLLIIFLNITDSLNLQNIKESSAISLLRDSYPNNFPNMKTIPITEVEIIGIINSLKSKNSSEYDEISSKLLKLCGPQISRPLFYIRNKSISMGIFPERLKYAIVKPLYKIGDKSSMTNYRPISSLTAISKVFETAMYHRLNHHLQVHNILVSEQYGFRKGMSTDNAGYKLTDTILKAWNKKMHVRGMFCDLAKDLIV